MFFHLTDFDQEYSAESVELVTVNKRVVTARCEPGPLVSGCKEIVQRPLVSCVNDVSIDHLMEKNGSLELLAKIADVVDECPYDGNLLSSVPMVTCMVSSKFTEEVLSPEPLQETDCSMMMPLRCTTRGCASEINLAINRECHLDQIEDTCTVNINVSQTDFDNQDGSSELIEYIMINGEKVAEGLNPGQNPCKEAMQKGDNSALQLDRAAHTFQALKDHEVKINKDGNNGTVGTVIVEAKISKFVDECASNGYLLDAVAHLHCKPKATISSGSDSSSSQSGSSLMQRRAETAPVSVRQTLLLRNRGRGR
jgi:hypothetical protein